MKAKIFFIIATFVLIFIGCVENNSTTKKDTEKQLIIEGKDIWIREKPFTGKVIMKLNSGDTCEIIEKGEEAQLKNMLDHWYKIKFNDTIGWVFGSQTNLKTDKIVEIDKKRKDSIIEITTIKKTPILSLSRSDTTKMVEKGTKIKIIKNGYDELYMIDGSIDKMYAIYNPNEYTKVHGVLGDYYKIISGYIVGNYTDISMQFKVKDANMPKWVINNLSPKTNQLKFNDFVNKNTGFYYISNWEARSSSIIYIYDIKDALFFNYGYAKEMLYMLTDPDTSIYKYSMQTSPLDYNDFYDEEGRTDSILVYTGKYNFNKLSTSVKEWHESGMLMFEQYETEEECLKELQEAKRYEKKIRDKQFSIVYYAPLVFYMYYNKNKWFIAGIENTNY